MVPIKKCEDLTIAAPLAAGAQQAEIKMAASGADVDDLTIAYLAGYAKGVEDGIKRAAESSPSAVRETVQNNRMIP